MQVIKYTVIALAVLSLFPLAGYVIMRVHLPDIDGTFYSESIREGVTVIRDNWGVPHISAGNGSDAYFAYGFTLAQDRLFQMELHRRIARGEIAELFGPAFLDFDRRFRTLLFRHTAEGILGKTDIDPEALRLLDAFLEGVNYFIEREPLPMEFVLLGIKPRRFTRLDCIAMVCYMAYSFAYGINSDSLVSMLKRKYPRYDIMELFPGYSREEPVTVMESQAFYKRNPELGIRRLMVREVDSPLAQFLPSIFRCFSPLNGASPMDAGEGVSPLFPGFGGSNSWVIAPSRSASGSAILANDAHVALSNPGIWYEAHVRYGDYENYGYHLPLLPFPMFAHNSDRAWAITMFENDDLDLYYETLHPLDESLVRYRGQWVKLRRLRELIRVRGGDDEPIEIRITPHGPIISDFLEGYEGKPVSLFWVCHRTDNPVLDILYRLSVARTMKSFRDAISRLAAPGLNFSYVDSRGNIAWWAAGRLPVRPRHVNSREILDGSSGRDEILGYLPFEKNPHLINPVSGIVVTANNKSTMRPVGPIRDIEGYWVPTDRAARIVELLSAREKWDIDDLREVQTDIKSIAAPTVVAAIRDGIEKSRAAERFNSLEESAYRALESWDCRYDIQSRGATIYHFIIYHILKESVEDEMGRRHFLVYCNLPEFWNFFKAFIRDDGSQFWDDINTSEKERREQIIARAYRSAIRELADRFGSDMDTWRWGRVHTIEYVHPIGLKKPLNLLFNIGPLPAPGEARTINRLSTHFGKHDYKVISVPSFRRLIDYRDLRHSYSILPSGNSGNILSPHYDDQVAMFLRGEYRVINFMPDQIQRNKMHEMVFLPTR